MEKLKINFGDKHIILPNLDKFMDLYKKNVDLRRAIKKISGVIGSKGFYFNDITTGKKIENTAILNDLYRTVNAKILPNMIFQFIRDTMILGTTIGIKIRSETNKLVGFQFLDIRNIRFVMDVFGGIKSIYVITNDKKFEYSDIVMYFDEQDPDVPFIGMSIIEPLIYELSSDSEAQIQTYSYFKNNMVPGSLVILDDNFKLSEEENKTFMDNIRKMFGGTDKKYKTVLMPGVKDIKQIQDSLKDMEFELLRKMTTEKICVMTGLSKGVLGYTENSGMGNNSSAVKDNAFIRDTILPRHSCFTEFVNDIIKFDYPNYEIVIIDNYIDNTAETINYYSGAIASGLMTINEARKYMGEAEYSNDNANTPIIKTGFELIDDIGFTPTTTGS